MNNIADLAKELDRWCRFLEQLNKHRENQCIQINYAVIWPKEDTIQLLIAHAEDKVKGIKQQICEL